MSQISLGILPFLQASTVKQWITNISCLDAVDGQVVMCDHGCGRQKEPRIQESELCLFLFRIASQLSTPCHSPYASHLRQKEINSFISLNKKPGFLSLLTTVSSFLNFLMWKDLNCFSNLKGDKAIRNKCWVLIYFIPGFLQALIS